LTIIILIIKQVSQNRAIIERSDSKNTRPPPIIPLGKWRWPALIFCSSIVIVTLIIPGSNLIYWVLRGVQAGEKIGNLWEATQNSILASGLAAVLILIAAIPIAIISVRYPNKLSGMIERTTYLSFALPGIVVALALVFFGSNYVSALYQSLPLLLFAYLVLFLPEAVGSVKTSLQQINPNLEEAARSLGSQPFRVFQKITFPLVRPGLVAGFGLVFLTTMKELSATLILSPIGYKTLAIGVWDAVSEAFFARAAAPALLIILISSVPLALMTFRKERKY
jgi:iron(III) transport system permease protein